MLLIATVKVSFLARERELSYRLGHDHDHDHGTARNEKEETFTVAISNILSKVLQHRYDLSIFFSIRIGIETK
jgi:hypothetical protein